MNDSESPAEQSTLGGFFVQASDVDVIAHRGGNGQWPEETIYAFTQAINGGADVIEMDVWGTADNPPVLVLMHSSNLAKTTEGNQKLPFCTYEEICELNAAYRWSPDGGRTFPFRNSKPTLRIARLEEVFEGFLDKRVNIEIKQKRPSIVEPLLDLIEKSNVSTDNLLVASFHTDVLKEFRAKCMERKLQIATSASTWEWLKFYVGSYLFRLHYKPPAEAIQMAERIPLIGFWLLTRGLVRRAHSFGLKIHAWTVNDLVDMQRAIVSGVDGIVTDFPGPLRAILTEPKRDQSLPRDASGSISSRLLNTWIQFRNKVAGFLSILRVVRFSLAMVLLPAIVLIFIGQGQEALQILATAPNQPTSQVVAFIIFLMLLTFMAWYWASILVDVLRPGARSEAGLKGWAAKQLPRICGIIPAVAIAIAFLVAADLRAHRSSPQAVSSSSPSSDSLDPDLPEESNVEETRPAVEVKDSPFRFVVFAIVSLLFTIPIYAIFYFRRRLLQKRGSQLGRRVESDEAGKQLPVRRLPRLSKLVLTITILIWLALLLVFALQTGDRPLTITATQQLGPVAIALFFAAVWVPIGSLLVFWSETYKIPLFMILFLLAAAFSIFNLNDNHKIRPLKPRTDPIPSLETAFAAWLNARCDRVSDAPYPVFIVSTEGGGLRAAYFTALVLSAAQEQNPAFAHHVFAISGVSGGSVGATVFSALTNKYVQQNSGIPCTFENKPPTRPDGTSRTMWETAKDVLDEDLLSPVLASALYPDLIQRFLFFPVSRFDRAGSLEDALRCSWESATNRWPNSSCSTDNPFSNKSSFYELTKDFPNNSTPALFLNTTEVETGQRMVVSSFDLWRQDGQPDPNVSGLLGINHIPMVDPNFNLPLSTAAFLSARFPVITPAGTICAEGPDCPRKTRYVDGGYFENSGTETLNDIIAALPRNYLYPPVTNSNSSTQESQPKIELQSNIKLIVISIGTDPYDVKYRPFGLGEITAPISAVLNTRSARGNTATRQLETAIRKLNSVRQNLPKTAETNSNNSSTDGMAEVIHFQAYETNVRLPTGWLLSEKARQNMECQIGIGPDKPCIILKHAENPGVRHCLNNRDCLAQIGKVISNLSKMN